MMKKEKFVLHILNDDVRLREFFHSFFHFCDTCLRKGSILSIFEFVKTVLTLRKSNST